MSINIGTPGQPVRAAPGPVDSTIQPANTRVIDKRLAEQPALADKVTLGSAVEPPATYGDPRLKPAMSPADLDAILADSDAKTQAVMNLILPLVEQQSLNLAKVVSGEQKLSADAESIDKAKAAIADDGEFGVQQVADRILGFAQSAMGDDPSKLASFRAAVEEGFKQAAEMLGGTLPEISEKTRTTIMATFDRWQAEGFGASAPDGTVQDAA